MITKPLDYLLDSWIDKLKAYKEKQQVARIGGPLDLFVYTENSPDNILNHPAINELKRLEADILNLEYEICKQIPEGESVQMDNGLIIEKRSRILKEIPRTASLSTRYLEQITIRWY